MSNATSQFLSRAQACDYLGIGLTTIDRLVKDRKVRYYQAAPSAPYRFRAVDLDAYMESIAVSTQVAPAWEGVTYRKRRKKA